MNPPCPPLRRALFAHDLVFLTYISILSVVVIVFWDVIRWPGVFLGYHAAVICGVALSIYAQARYGGRFWTFVRYWFPVLLVLGAFREIFYLAPHVHPFDDMTWDRRLDAFDVALFGDVGTWLRALLWRPAVDVLSFCYWTYFFLPFILSGTLWVRGDRSSFRELFTILSFAWLLSYLGYLIFPAMGPHVLEQSRGLMRDPAWNGVVLAHPLHRLLMQIEWRMPDAFPSGHVLASALFILAAFRYRIWRPVITFLGLGIILATVYLRYHYIADVLTSLALVPVCWFGAGALHRRWEAGRLKTSDSRPSVEP